MKLLTWIVIGFAIWGSLDVLGCAIDWAPQAVAGTCRIYRGGAYTVQACDTGAYTATGRDGRKRVYGEPNAGFERYPGMGPRPMFPRQDYRK